MTSNEFNTQTNLVPLYFLIESEGYKLCLLTNWIKQIFSVNSDVTEKNSKNNYKKTLTLNKSFC
jgi:hypothetical protein